MCSILVAPAFVEAGEAEADAALFTRMDLADKTPDSFSYIRGSECTKIEGTKSNIKNPSEIRKKKKNRTNAHI